MTRQEQRKDYLDRRDDRRGQPGSGIALVFFFTLAIYAVIGIGLLISGVFQ